MSQTCTVNIRFFSPPAALRRYFTTFYVLEWHVEGGGKVIDHILPEWANLRFFQHDCAPDARTVSGMEISGAAFTATGPTSRGIRFAIGSGRSWGIGLLPQGWSKFVKVPAAELADAVVDGAVHPAFASFRPLAETLFGQEADQAGERKRIEDHFLARLDEPEPDCERIGAIHAGLVDTATHTVAGLVAKTGVSQRTVERICARAFGFSPKQLIRRQRFMRSLSDFMLDPSLKWIGALDSHYHDQAQFVRDFREFMGMTPREYAALDKPLLSAIMQERARMAGSPAQTMDSPEGPTVSA